MHSPSSNFTTNAAKASHNRSKALVLWLQLCTIVSHISPHLVELQGYPFEKLMLQKMIEPFADTTLLKYLPQVLQFFQAALDQSLCLASLTMPQVIEILWNYHDRLHSDDPEFKTGSSALSCIKALRWCVKLLQLPFPDLYSGPISALTFAEHERKESLPLPLAVLVFWERCIINGWESLQFRIFVGAALCCVWASLRFADASHVRWSDMIIDQASVRGISFRTKTSRSGMPFGIAHHGFLSSLNDPESSWLTIWLSLLDELWLSLRDSIDDIPDSLFMLLENDKLVSPMSYGQSLKTLRHCISSTPKLGMTADQIESFTLHSMKTTMLSWGCSIAAPSRDQGLARPPCFCAFRAIIQS